jgi:Tfp pilus assembly protein PilN
MSAPNQLSFLPDDYLDLKRQQRTNAVCATLFALMVVGIGGVFHFTEKQMKAVEAEHADISRRYADAARPIEQFKRMQEQQRKMESQAALSASLLEKVPRSYLLAEITNALPAQVSLLDFGLSSTPKVVVPNPNQFKTIYEQKKAEIEAQKILAAGAGHPKVFDVQLKLTGMAANDVQVAQFMNNLAKSKLLRDVNLVVSDEFQPTPQDAKLRKFQIEMSLNPEAEVKRPDQKKINSIVEAADAK